MMRNLTLPILLGSSLILSVASVGVAAAPPPATDATPSGQPKPSSEECLGCHGDKDLKKEVAGKSVSLFADEALLKASVHAQVECTACHAGITDVPHPEKLAPVSCQRCHAEVAKKLSSSIHGAVGGRGPRVACQSCHGTHAVLPAAKLGAQPCRTCHSPVTQAYEGSVHAQALSRGIRDASLCFDCHGEAHQLRSHLDPESPTFRTRTAQTCSRCHADRALVERRHIPIPRAYQLYQQSVHGRAVAAGKPAATCNDCHESHDLRRANDPKSSVYRENIPKTCGKCHAGESRAYRESVHGIAVARGVTKSPVCTDCHGEHSIRAARDPESRVSVARVSKTCGTCHEAQRISEEYDIPGDRLETYADSYHGLAARGGSKVAANCASCHGVHDIRPSEDPKSAINPKNLPITCGKCHPGAGENFAKGAVHVAFTAHEEPILFYIRNFYILLIVATISGMSVHNGLDFLKKLRREFLRRGGGVAAIESGEYNAPPRGPQGWIERMTLSERWQHALMASSFVVLVYTGFALKFPDTWLFSWLVALERGYAWRSWIHRGAAVVMVLACLWHLVYLPTRRGRAHLSAMRPRYEDAKEFALNVAYLFGLRAEPPRFDRFSYIEKAEYWALIWGSVVMAGTGFMLWFENLTLKHLAKWLLDLATLVHYYEAWLAMLAILVWHFYAVIFNPDVYPMNWTWLTGKVSEEMLQHEHPREYERLRERNEV
jgi:cytochrome b subunit of formate dehydrogenase